MNGIFSIISNPPPFVLRASKDSERFFSSLLTIIAFTGPFVLRALIVLGA